jgi:hypothetical protein
MTWFLPNGNLWDARRAIKARDLYKADAAGIKEAKTRYEALQ